MAKDSAISASTAVSTSGTNSSSKEVTSADLLKFVMGSIVAREVLQQALSGPHDDKNAAAAVGSFAALMFAA